MTVSFQAKQSKATIFLRGSRTNSLVGWVQFDAVAIEVTSGSGNRPPTAAASASPTQGAPPLAVQLDGSASQDPDGDVLAYNWDFGDGSPHAGGAKVSHSYVRAGTFTATLTVSDGKGGSALAAVTITVQAGGPPAVDWDPRLDPLGVQLVPASVPSGTGYWKLVRARFESDGEILPPPGGGSESHGRHSVFYQVLAADGTPIESKRCLASWPTGNPTTTVALFTKGHIDGHWGDFAMGGGNWCPYYPQGPRGPYGASVADAPSDEVWGMGLPCNRHVSFRLTWRWPVKE